MILAIFLHVVATGLALDLGAAVAIKVKLARYLYVGLGGSCADLLVGCGGSMAKTPLRKSRCGLSVGSKWRRSERAAVLWVQRRC